MDEFIGLIFAIVQSVSTANGLRMVNIVGVPNVAACESYIDGARQGDPTGQTSIERAECVDTLPADYQEAMLERPIPFTMTVAYEISQQGRQWPVRIIHSGLAEQWQSDAGCDLLVQQYRTISGPVRCINGY